VHESFLEIGLRWSLITCSAETGETFIVNESLNRVEPGDDNVDTQVKLDAVEE